MVQSCQSQRSSQVQYLTCAVGLVAIITSSGDAALVARADAVSPIANTRTWPSTRSVGSVAVVPRADTGKGKPSLWREVDAVLPVNHTLSEAAAASRVVLCYALPCDHSSKVAIQKF
jgi:hypothetical protein